MSPNDEDRDYDPMPVLNSLTLLQLWVIAGDDTEAPPETTLNRLGTLKRGGGFCPVWQAN